MLMEELAKEFILDCKVRNLAPRTVRNYEKQLSYFTRFLQEAQGVKELEELKPVHIKQFTSSRRRYFQQLRFVNGETVLWENRTSRSPQKTNYRAASSKPEIVKLFCQEETRRLKEHSFRRRVLQIWG